MIKDYIKGSAKNGITGLVVMMLAGLLMTACKKETESNGTDTGSDTDTTGTTDTVFYKLTRMQNFAATTSDDANTVPATLYYSLENKKVIESSFAKTRQWDIAFGGLYNSFLSGNNGSNGSNYGAGSSGVGGILILEQAFDAVTAVPNDAQFKTGANVVGTDDAGDYGQGMGWYVYDFGGVHVRNNEYENQHVAYALGDTLRLANGKKVNPRTIVVKTAKGNYAKIRMISCYKDLFKQAEWHRTAPHMYFTFEYVLVPAGSTRFETK
jgi:hypothetical protein